jgi:hypothetical protein
MLIQVFPDTILDGLSGHWNQAGVPTASVVDWLPVRFLQFWAERSESPEAKRGALILEALELRRTDGVLTSLHAQDAGRPPRVKAETSCPACTAGKADFPWDDAVRSAAGRVWSRHEWLEELLGVHATQQLL